jgi:predicted RNA-binding Zn-ribbon protein involved in translation (DUF1610 family)
MDIKLISASRVKTYEHCRYKYVLNYMLKECKGCGETFYTVEMVEEDECPYCGSKEYGRPEMRKNWGAVHGSALHEIMENYANAIRGTTEDGKKVLVKDQKKWKAWRARLKEIYYRQENGISIINLAKSKDVQDDSKWCNGCSAGGDALCEITGEHLSIMQDNGCAGCPKSLYNESVKIMEKYMARYEPMLKQRKILGVESQFDIDLGLVDMHGNPIRMFGYIDLVTELDKDTVEVTDHKFGAWVPSFDEFSEDLQVKMYSVAARQLFPNYKEYIMTFDYARRNPMSYAFEADEDECTKEEVIQHWKNIAGPQTVRRTMVQGNGTDPMSSWKCKVMCDAEVCKREWPKFKEKFSG